MRTSLLFCVLLCAGLKAQDSSWITRHEALLAPGQSIDLDTERVLGSSSMQGAEMHYERRARGPMLRIVRSRGQFDEESWSLGGRNVAELSGEVTTDDGRLAVWRARVVNPHESGLVSLSWWLGQKGLTSFRSGPSEPVVRFEDDAFHVSWEDSSSQQFRLRVSGLDFAKDVAVSGHEAIVSGVRRGQVYLIEVSSVDSQGRLSLPAQTSCRAAPFAITREIVSLPSRWFDAHGGISLLTPSWDEVSPDVVLYLYGIWVSGGGIQKLGEGELAWNAAIEVPAEGYARAYGRLDEGDVLAVRTREGLYGKMWLEGPSGDCRNGLDVHVAMLSSGGRTFPRGPSAATFQYEQGILKVQWTAVPGAVSYDITLPGPDGRSRRVTEPEADLHGLDANRFHAMTITAIMPGEVWSEPLPLKAHTYSPLHQLGEFTLSTAKKPGSQGWSFSRAEVCSEGDLEITNSAGGASSLRFSSAGGLANGQPFGLFPDEGSIRWKNSLSTDVRKPGDDVFLVKTREGGTASVRIARRSYPTIHFDYVYRPKDE